MSLARFDEPPTRPLNRGERDEPTPGWWYIGERGDVVGPVDEHAFLRVLSRVGHGGVLCWRAGLDGWVRADTQLSIPAPARSSASATPRFYLDSPSHEEALGPLSMSDVLSALRDEARPERCRIRWDGLGHWLPVDRVVDLRLLGREPGVTDPATEVRIDADAGPEAVGVHRNVEVAQSTGPVRTDDGSGPLRGPILLGPADHASDEYGASVRSVPVTPSSRRRCAARYLDVFILAAATGVVLGPYADFSSPLAGLVKYNVAYLPFVCALLVIVEAISVALFGTTPGKAVYNLSVMEVDGHMVGFDASLKRAMGVFVRGMGIGIVPFTIGANVWFGARGRGDRMPWDRSAGTVVVAGPMHATNKLIAVFAWTVIVGLVAVAAFA